MFTRDGDYLANYRDHDAHRREFARFSGADAEAYDRYARDVIRQCRFIQPLLMRTAARPDQLSRRATSPSCSISAANSPDLTEREMALTCSASGPCRSRISSTSISRPMSSRRISPLSGIIGTALGPMSPGTAYVLLHHYMGEVDGSIGAWGFARGGMGAVTQALAASLQAARRRDPHRRRASSKCWSSAARATRRRARRAARRSCGKLVVSNLDVKRTFLKLVERKGTARRSSSQGQELQDPRLVRQGQHRARSACRNSRRCPKDSPAIAATCISPIRSSAWSAPMTTGRPGAGRPIPSSTW